MWGRIGAKEIEKRRREKDEAERKNRSAKRYFQWWHVPSDRFASLVAVFTGVLAIVGIFQWVILDGQQGIMQGQLNLMGADERPWVSIENLKITSELAHDAIGWQSGTRWHITVSYQLRNYGKTPATHVIFWAHIVPIVLHYVENGTPHGMYIGDELNNACNWGETSTDLGIDTGSLVFPGEEWPLKTYEIQGDEKVFETAKGEKPSMYAGQFLVPVCVTYRSVYANIYPMVESLQGLPPSDPRTPIFGDDRYRTAEGYGLGKKSNGIDLAGETVPQADLILAAPGFQATNIK